MIRSIEKSGAGAVTWLFRVLGMMPKKQKLGQALGRLIYQVDGRHRRIALQNIGRAFPETSPHDAQQLARRAFENLGQVPFEIGWSLNHHGHCLFRRFRIQGWEHIRRAYERGNGVLVLTAHFGNWELLTVIAARLGYKLSIVYRPLDFAPLERFIVKLRTRFGGKLIPKKKSMRQVLRSLKQGEMAALLMDQNVDWYDGVFTDFFDHPACTNKGMALLALKTGAPVVPCFLAREENGFVGVFLPAVPTIKTGDRFKDIEQNTLLYNRTIEAMIRQYPAQWFWVHQRWKGKPYRPWPRVQIPKKSQKR